MSRVKALWNWSVQIYYHTRAIAHCGEPPGKPQVDVEHNYMGVWRHEAVCCDVNDVQLSDINEQWSCCNESKDGTTGSYGDIGDTIGVGVSEPSPVEGKFYILVELCIFDICHLFSILLHGEFWALVLTLYIPQHLISFLIYIDEILTVFSFPLSCPISILVFFFLTLHLEKQSFTTCNL